MDAVTDGSGNRSRRVGFTLIELLVVVSIIALLIAILMPALGSAKKQAQAVVCQSRIKALSIAAATYLAEWDNTFPINGVIIPKFIPDNTDKTKYPFFNFREPAQQHWRLEYGALWRQMGGIPADRSSADIPPIPPDPLAKAYLCPSDTFQRTGAQALTFNRNDLVTPVQLGPGSPGYWSYSVNSVLNSLGRFRNNFAGPPPWADPLKFTQIVSPTNFIYFIEEAETSLFNDEVFEPPAYSQGDILTDRHAGKGNVGFGDGHVEAFSAVAFNLGSGGSGTPDNWTAIQKPYTRLFFPDGGAFASPP